MTRANASKRPGQLLSGFAQVSVIRRFVHIPNAEAFDYIFQLVKRSFYVVLIKRRDSTNTVFTRIG